MTKPYGSLFGTVQAQVMESGGVSPVIAEAATIIALTLVVLIFAIRIASVLISIFSRSLVIFLAVCLVVVAGFLMSLHAHPAAIPAGIAVQLGGLLLAVGGVQLHRRWVSVWHALNELSATADAPSIVPHLSKHFPQPTPSPVSEL
jgi:hypothetical protein